MNEPAPAPRTPRRWRARPESWWWISAVVLIPVAVLTGLAALVLVLTTHPTGSSDQLTLVRTALSVGAGTGGVVALVLAGRRQWHAEQAQRAAERDATERRITELYTKAVEQLGADKAPVRLGGLYALERLAQDNPRQRQTIVNVICAYLRMPYTPPAEQAPSEDALEPEQARFEQRTQERQVRLTAQLILTTHLRPGEDPHPVEMFWPNISLDLTGATLIDFTLYRCHLHTAQFASTRFTGGAHFARTRFTGRAGFDGARFAGSAGFSGAEFAGSAGFGGTEFAGDAWFRETRFAGNAGFGGARFDGDAMFDDAEFDSAAGFGGVRFAGLAVFSEARFDGSTWFDTAVEFDGDEGCWVRRDAPDSFPSQRTWPAGWAVVPTTQRPPGAAGEWGRLVREPTAIPEHSPRGGAGPR